MNKFEIVTAADEESFQVFFNEQLVASADHDKNGWAGMEDVENIIVRLAELLGASVEYHVEEQ